MQDFDAVPYEFDFFGEEEVEVPLLSPLAGVDLDALMAAPASKPLPWWQVALRRMWRRVRWGVGAMLQRHRFNRQGW